MIVDAFSDTLDLGLQKPEQTVVCIVICTLRLIAIQ